MDLKQNYREVDCCYNCKHSVNLADYEETPSLYCDQDETYELTGIVDHYSGCLTLLESPEIRQAKLIAKKWLNEHECDVRGMCDNFARE